MTSGVEHSSQSNPVNRPYFDDIADAYHVAAQSWASMTAQVGEILNPSITNKKMIDVGSGGLFAYDASLPAELTLVDISEEMLSKISNSNIKKMVGDARSLEGIGNESLDIIYYSLVLHHINGNSVQKSLESLNSIFKCALKKLKPGGQMIIVEPFLKDSLFRAETLLFSFQRVALWSLRSPMIYFYSLKGFLKQAEKFSNQIEFPPSVVELQIKEPKVDPLAGTFPGWIEIPTNWLPVEFKLVKLTKKTPRTRPVLGA